MARRSRSLSELPGHLRVPILKRKDTERTQARLQAGLAGMEELRVLREQHQQLIGDTMARVEDRQQRRHSIPRRHGDDGLMTSGRSKMSSSTGQSSASPHDVISSWQSASSLASISEEGDTMASRDPPMSKNRRSQSYRDTKLRDNRKSPDDTTDLDDSCKDYDFSPFKRQLVSSQSHLGETPRSWRSQEYVCPMPKSNEHQQSPTAFESANEPGTRKVRRSMSLSLAGSGEPHNLPKGNAFFNYRRNSTSMIHDLPSGDLSRSYSSHNVHSKGQRRYPLSSISNIHMPTAVGESPLLYGQSYTPSSSDRNCSQISWDNLLKTIGISSSASSLTSLVEDENSDKIDDVFHSEENPDEIDDDSETQPPLPDKRPCHKMGRSFSFCHGSTVTNSRNYSQLLFQRRAGNSLDEEEEDASSQLYANARQTFQPIMRRASMQCEAVLTRSGMAKRRVNPIQDVDINTLTNPGPVHAVMLQYTSPKVGVLSNSNTALNTISSDRKISDSKVKTQPLSESEHKYLKMERCEKGKECELVKSGTEFQDFQSSANECENKNGRVHNSSDHPMNNAECIDHGLSKRKDIERHFPEIKEKSQVGNNSERRNSTDEIAKMDITSSRTVRNTCARSSCEVRLNETVMISDGSLSKTGSDSIRASASTATRTDGDYVKVGMQNPDSLPVVESSSKDSNLDKSPEAFAPCSSEPTPLLARVGSSKPHHCTGPDSNGHQTMIYSEGNGNKSHSRLVGCSLVHPGGVAKAASNAKTVDNEGVANASNSALGDIGINDSDDGHVIKYYHDDVSKISSDLSIISDEGYSTSESVVSTTTKACMQSRENGLNLLDSSSVSESISSVGDIFGTAPKPEQEMVTERCDLPHSHKFSCQSNGQAHSGKTECRYENVAVLETGVALVWNPEPCKKPTKSLHRHVFAHKSLKQTAV